MNVPSDAAHQHLYQRVKRRLDDGAAKQNELLTKVNAMVIRDKLVAPRSAVFEVHDGEMKIGYVKGGPPQEWFKIHRHAMSQLAQKVRVAAAHVTECSVSENNEDPPQWGLHHLANTFNTFFTHKKFRERAKDKEVAFLHRLVDNELRGFLSRRFNRHLASAILLDAFIDACDRVSAAPIEANISPVKVFLKCYQPFIYEPVQGEFICLGAEWSNSDFGSGRMQVCTTIWRVTSDTYSTLDHSISKVHIGSIIEESDIEMSEETAHKEAEAQASAINDAVSTQLSPNSTEKVLNAIAAAHAEDIPWAKLKGQLSRFMSKKEVENIKDLLTGDVFDLPPVRKLGPEKVANKWWTSNAIAWLANKTDDTDRRAELEHHAGALLTVQEDE
jgi:hypothetical protein